MLASHRLGFAVGLLLLASSAQAQQAVTVPNCSTRTSRVGDGAPLSVLQNGDLCVTGVSGGSGTASTVTANQGTAGTTAWPVTWTGNLGVTVSNFPASQAVTGTFWQATQPVSLASSPLPSGAATAANQNVTAAGTTATSAQAVQGVAGGVPQPITVRASGTNRSATVTTTASTLMAANTARQGWKIKNDSTGDLWINFDATATATAGSGNMKIPPGGYLASEPGFIETGAMSAIASASIAVTAREH